MNTLRDFIRVVDEAVLRSSDGKPVTDGSGKVVSTGSTTPAELQAAQKEVPPPSAPANTTPAPANRGATRGFATPASDSTPAPTANVLGVQQQANITGDVTIPGGGSIRNVDPNSDEGRAMIARSQAVQNTNTTQPTATPPAQAAQAAGSKNRDSMAFGQAFADARKSGEKIFTWKGKSYNTELAKPKTQAPSGIMPAKPSASGSTLTPQQNAQIQALMSQRVAAYQRGDTAAVARFDAAIKQWATGVEQSKPTSESVGYKEDQNLVSIVHLAGLK